MKIRVSELMDGSCFRDGRTKWKKLSDGKAVNVTKGRVRTRHLRGDPEVTPVPCDLKLLGVGLRRHPEQVVEIGDGNLLKKRRDRR